MTSYSSIPTKCTGDAVHDHLLSSLDETPISWTRIVNALSECRCGHVQSLLEHEHHNTNRLIAFQGPLWINFLFCFHDLDTQNPHHLNVLRVFLLQGVDVDCSLKSYTWAHGRIPVTLYKECTAATGIDYWPTILDYFYYHDGNIFLVMAPFSKALRSPGLTRPGALAALRADDLYLQNYLAKYSSGFQSPPKLKQFLETLLWEHLAFGSFGSSTYKLDLDLLNRLFPLCEIRLPKFTTAEAITFLVSAARYMPQRLRPDERVTFLGRLVEKKVDHNMSDKTLDRAKKPGNIEGLSFRSHSTVLVEGWEKIKTAVRQNSFGLVLQSLDDGFDINSEGVCLQKRFGDRTFSRNLSPLAALLTEVDQTPHQRVNGVLLGCCASYEMMDYLIRQGARLSIPGGQSDSCPVAFLRFVMWEDPSNLLDRLKYLVERIDNFNNACSYCSTYLLEECLALGCDRNGRHREDRFGVFQFLWERGIRQKDGSLLSALIQSDAPDRLIKVCMVGSNVNQYCHDYSSRRRDHRSRTRKELRSLTPLQAAACKINEELVRYLLQKGASVNAPARGRGGRTVLQAICEAKTSSLKTRQTKLRIVKLLLEVGAEANASPARLDGVFLLTEAIRTDSMEVIRLLIESGVDVNAPSGVAGKLPLDLASLYGRDGIVNLLLNAGAVSHSRGASGYDGAIAQAQRQNHVDIVFLMQRYLEERRENSLVGPLVGPPEAFDAALNHDAADDKRPGGHDGVLEEDEMEAICYNNTQDMIMGYYVEGKVENVVHGPWGQE